MFTEYDALSRLIRVKNPEQDTNSSLPAYTDPVTGGSGWSTAYTYDPNGNLASKTDARNITTTYTYDDLNRNTKVEYSSYDNGSSIVERYYDGATNGKGKYWYEIAYNKRWEKATDNLAYQQSKVDAYDPLGRPNSLSQGFQGVDGAYKTLSMRRSYDLAGNVIAQSYPSSRGVTYTFDTAGRLKSFRGGIGDFVDRKYVTDIQYNGYGSVSREAYGTPTPLYLNMHYNSRLQMVDLRLGTNADDENDLSGGALTFYYGTNAKNSGNPLANSADNNGNVLRQVNTVPLAGGGQVVPQMDDYSYDALNRITAVDEQQRSQDGTSIPLFTQSFSYDRWGNRTINGDATTTGIPGVTRKSFAADTGTNRMTSVDGVGITYDAAGNQTYDGTGERYYDNENRMTKAVQGGQTHYYFYDASGKRARRILNGSQTSGGVETWFVYGFDGELVAEYTYNQVSPPSSTAAVKEYGYRNGKLLVAWDGTQSGDKKLKWRVTDHLGSTRMEVDGSGSVAGIARIDYLPFGEELTIGVGIRSANIGYGQDSVRQKFGSKERDTETGLDYFGARYFASVQGRFTSVDPARIKRRHLFNPQDLNRYSYVANNPLRYIDPNGKERIEIVVNTFIPQPSVGGFRGDNRNIGEPGTHRTQQRIIIETDPSINKGNPLIYAGSDTGTTHGLGVKIVPMPITGSPLVFPQSEGKASGNTLMASATQDEKTGAINVNASGNESNPLVPGSPGITYNFTIGVSMDGSNGNVGVTVTGEHDGFPAYEVIVTRPEMQNNTPTVVYGSDPRQIGKGPLALFPPRDVTVMPTTVVIEPFKKKKEDQ